VHSSQQIDRRAASRSQIPIDWLADRAPPSISDHLVASDDGLEADDLVEELLDALLAARRRP
jgi:hypothetical protein